ncbi:unnamed protein product [Bursaphelenchus okinawaensis]|uniref:Amidase domain-containing protein n=1 Tax=Bursaphelenchus okinawaensis TaxID=465554 RepID=A0A811KTD8_9BILA|nr:unnamed protein product [Bursaphelenchus okinawaensis]CAG9112965.1 unnamed protein product [Bursaphelenchus okinawaensis]
MKTDVVAAKNDLPKLPFNKFDPGAIALQVTCLAVSKFAASNAKKTVVSASSEPLLNISATNAAKDIREGRLKSTDLVTAYLNRIREVNAYINAVTESFEGKALTMAIAVDEYIALASEEEIRNLEKSRPLFGIPISIKHVFDYKGHQNICGLEHLRAANKADCNAPAVERVLQAGAIPICYTNTPPGCLCFESDNAVFGRTKSPHDSRTICGGSSGGEAALLAAQGSLIGVGTDLGGSIRVPSILCGVYGLKPHETCPLDGTIPKVNLGEGSDGMYVVGPMARYAEDLMLLQNVLTCTSITAVPSTQKPSRLYLCTPEAKPLVRLSKTVKNVTNNVADYLSQEYTLKIEDFNLVKSLKEYFVIYKEMITNSIDIPNYLSPNESVKVPKEFLKLLTGASSLSFGLLMTFYSASKKSPKGLNQEAKRQLAIVKQKVLQQLKDDAVLVFPALPDTHYFHFSYGILPSFYTTLFNLLGVPVLAVPCGKDNNGYPLSVQLVGGPGSESLLCQVAQNMEKRFGGWVQPSES